MSTIFNRPPGPGADEALDSPMRRFVWRRRRLRAAGAACVGGALVLAWVLAVGLVDRGLRLGQWPRVATLGALLLIAAASFMRVVMLLIDRRFNRQVAARQIESMDHDLAERLMTVVTQADLPAGQRGSPQLTAVLAAEVAGHLRHAPPHHRLTWRFVRPAVVVLALVAAAAIALGFVPWLGLPRLVARQLFPLADLPPVTTTRIEVLTGSVDLPQGQSLAVVADVADCDGPVTLLIGADDSQLQPIAATRVFGGRYSATVRAIEADQVYRVQAGDATSPAYHVRVMRRPGMVRLGLTLDFPAYLRRGPLAVGKSSGRIEAVRGTRVRATVVGTEPLRQVTAALPDGVLPGDATIDPAVRTLDFVIGQSGPWSINLVSERGVTGGGPGGMAIVAIEDKPPAARLLKTDLRLTPTDIAAVPFDAGDDFGLQSLRLDVSAGGKLLLTTPVALPPERRAVQDVTAVDLAPLAMTYGDVVSLTLVATDTAGQTTTSAPCQLLLSPRSMDLQALRRAETLTAARELAESAVDNPADAAALTRATLRAIAASDSPRTADALERQVDVAQQAASASVWDAQPNWTPAQSAALRDVADRLKTLERGEQAQGVLADMENVSAAEQAAAGQTPRERAAAKTSVQRAKREIGERVQALQLAPDAGDTPARLKQLVADRDAAVRDAAPPPAEQIAQAWSSASGTAADIQRDRMAIAAQSQVLRGDSDLTWARDQQQIARAMAAVDGRAEAKPDATGDAKPGANPGAKVDAKTDAATRERVKEAARALEAQHALKALPRPPQDKSAEVDQVARRAAAAREMLAKLSGESSQNAAAAPSLLEAVLKTPAQLEQEHDRPLADDATADAAADSNAGADKGPEKWTPPPDATAAADAADSPAERQARSLNGAARQQQRLTARTDKAAPEAAHALGQQQQQVADALKQIEAERDDDFFKEPAMDREQALAALRQLQRDAADLPQQMLAARENAQSAVQAPPDTAGGPLQPADSKAAGSSPPKPQTNAPPGDGGPGGGGPSGGPQAQVRAQTQARMNSLGASLKQSAGGMKQLGATGRPVSAAADQLAGSLETLKKQLAAGDLPAADREQAAALQSIAALQATLRTAQRQVIDRDPVVAARFFAQQAAAALRREPPDLLAARSDQRVASASLEQAWDQAMARAVKGRLGGLPSFRGLLDDDVFAAAAAGPAALSRSSTPQWGRLRTKQTADVVAGESEFQPAGYEQPLAAYFEALGKARSSKGSP